MELICLHKRVIGLDVHQAQITACAIIEAADGVVQVERRTFKTFKRWLFGTWPTGASGSGPRWW